MKAGDEQTAGVVQQLTEQLTAAGIEVLVDDRNARAGVTFNDADLIGVPLRVVIGPRGLKEGKLEAKWRWDKDAEMITLDDAAQTLTDWISDERDTAQRFRNAVRRKNCCSSSAS
jgi:prolyl-tRNA synthetase